MGLQRLFRYTTIKKRDFNVMISKEEGFACCLRVAASSNNSMNLDWGTARRLALRRSPAGYA
jgi:hypothetical protein